MVTSFPSKLTEKFPMPNASTRWRLENEDLHIRNHDQEAEYDVQLRITQDDDVCHEAEYHLLPDQSGSSVNLVDSGQYTVTASIDDSIAKTAVITVSNEPDQTISIEIINGTLRITEGVN